MTSPFEAITARARQAFGLDGYSIGTDPPGMDLVRAVALAEWLAGAEAVGVRFRPWRGNEKADPGYPWAVDLLIDDQIEVTVRYQIGDIGEPVVRDLPIREVWRLAGQRHAELFEVHAADPGVWFWAVGDVVVDGVRYFVELEDRRGLGGAVWDPEQGGDLLRMVRAAQGGQTEARERAEAARRALGAEHGPVEAAALVDHLADPSEDDGPPAVSFVVISKAPGKPSKTLYLPGRRHRGRRRLSRLATVGVDALMVAAVGATRHEYLKKWRLTPARPDDIGPGSDGDGAPDPADPPSAWRRTHRIPDPTGEDAVRLALFDALTERERAVATLTAAGLTQHEIADRLHLARSTVELALGSARRKLRPPTDEA
ncbi:MAG: LuxR C-terminal-related transcriptional regulator [Acidimicrobiales bacterium]